MIKDDLSTFNTASQNEALINEFKGNLFEYLVGALVARSTKVEANFIKSFTGAVRKQFAYYETWLRLNDPEVVKALPVLASAVVDAIKHRVPKNVQNVLVIGKMASGSGNDELGESDLFIESNSGGLPISLKLCKSGAFVNTKSAGIKSFFTKYFSEFSDIAELQDGLSQVVDDSFTMMAHELHELAGLEFEGRFTSSWVDAGYSELPGQLPEKMSQSHGNFYKSTINEIYRVCQVLFERDPKKFIASLWPLLGFSNRDVLQVTCFHKSSVKDGESKKYLLHSVEVTDFNEIDLDDYELMPLKEGISSFEIRLGSTVLQLRVKAMNKFTTPGLKVNCSVKSLRRDR